MIRLRRAALLRTGRMPGRLFLIAVALLWGRPPASAAQWAERCAADSREAKGARTALAKLVKQIAALPPERDPAPLEKQLKALLESSCFRIARHEFFGKFDSGLALKIWWNSGGNQWLTSVLSKDRVLVLPPEQRATLSLNGTPEQPLAALLCSLADPACGRQTSGWAERAEAALAARARAATVAAHEKAEQTARDSKQTPFRPADCAARAREAPPDLGYQQWHTCIEKLYPAQDALPLGRVRAPTHGFWVVHGRRGHYGFCDELRAYDLASGAAYVAQSCGELRLSADGSVNGLRTDAGRGRQVLTGQLPIDNLREAVWMALLRDKVESHKRVQAYSVAIPVDIKVQLPLHGTYERVLSSSFGGWFSTAQTQLSWMWVDGGRVLGRGTLTWPDSSDAAEDYAVELLRIAEAGMTPGCSPTPPPPVHLLAEKAPSVNRLDAPTGVTAVHDELLEMLAQVPRCTPSLAAPPVQR